MTTSTIEKSLLHIINDLWEQKSLTALKQFLAGLRKEEDYNALIQQAYDNHMMQYADFLKRHAHKKFNSLQTTLWQAGVLFNQGHSFKAEELVVNRVFQESLEGEIPHNLQVEAAHLLARIYGGLLRFEEAEQQHALLEKLESLTPLYEVYLLMDKIEREQAITLIESLSDEQKSEYLQRLNLILTDLYILEGEPKKSLEYITACLNSHPNSFILRAERVPSLYLAEDYEQALSELHAVNGLNPFHHLKNSFVYIEAHALYKLERFNELAEHVKKHAAYFKNEPYEFFSTEHSGKRVQLELQQNVQKVNYCVPASLSLILQSFGVQEEQETIARAVKEDQGTQLYHAREYMTDSGFESVYFKGTVENYKKLIDAGLPILLSTLIEMNAHVQVVVGYDDQLQTLLIQDPNDVNPFNLRYDKLKETYQLRDNLSLVFFPKEKAFVREWFDANDHAFFEELYKVTSDEDEENFDAAAFFEKHPGDVSTAVIGLLMQSNEVAQETAEKWLALVAETFGESHRDVKLLQAHYYFWKEKYDKALACLKFPGLATNSNSQFIKAVSHMKLGQVEYALKAFHRSLEGNPYQSIVYSYLARMDQQIGYHLRAYKWAEIALRMSPKDAFAQATLALVYFENSAYEEAFSRFKAMAKEDPKDAYAVYEMARARQYQLRLNEAETLYRKSLDMDPSEPFAYLRLAEIHDTDPKKHREVLEEGHAKLPQAVGILMELASLESDNGNFAKAQHYYEQAAIVEPEDVELQLHIAQTLLQQDKKDEALAIVDKTLQREELSVLFEISRFAENFKGWTLKERIARRLEERIETATGDELEDLAIHYIDFSNEPVLLARVVDTFAKIRSRETSPELLSLEGQLYEQMGISQTAEQLYNKAGDHIVALNQLARVSNEREDMEEFFVRMKRLLRIAPFHDEALPALIEFYEQQGDFATVLKICYFSYQASKDLVSVDAMLRAAHEEEKLDELAQFFASLQTKVSQEWYYVIQAEIAQASGNLEQAEELYLLATQESNAYLAHKVYLNFLVDTGRSKVALKQVKELMAQHPEDDEFTGIFLLILQDQKKTLLANRHLKKLPKDQWALHYQNLASHMESNFFQLAEDEESGLAAVVSKGKQIYYAGYAITFYEEARKLLPGDEQPAIKLAEFYLNSNQPEEAIKLLLSYAKVEGSAAERFLILAYGLKLEQKPNAKDNQEVRKRIASLLERTPHDLQLYDGLAQSYAFEEEYQRAIDVLEQGLQISPYYVEFYSMIWKSLEFLHGDKAGPYLKNFNKRLPAIVQQHNEFRIGRAVSFVDLGDTEAASELLATFDKNSGFYDASRYERARVEVLLGNKNEARKLLRSVLANDEDGSYEALASEDELLVGLL